MFEEKIDYRKYRHIPYHSQNSQWSLDNMLEQKEIEIEQFTEVGQNEILLGYDPDDPNEIVTIPFNPRKRITMVIQGDNNSGKSVLARNIVCDQLHARFGRKVLFLDPKGDSRNLKIPNRNASHRRILSNYNIMPTNYHVKYISPIALNVQGAWARKPDGILYKIGLDGYNKIENKEIRLNMLLNLFFTQKGEASARALQAFFLAEFVPSKMYQLKEMVQALKPKVLVLDANVDLYEKTDVLGDKGIDYAKLLNENGILAVETVVSDPKKDTLQDVFIEDTIQHCVQDRTKSVITGNQEGNLSQPFTVLMEESDIFCGVGKNTAGITEQLVTKFREISPEQKAKGIATYGCDAIFVVQHSNKIEQVPVSEADWVIFSRISDEHDFDNRIADRGYDSVHKYDFMNMEYDANVWPKLHMAIDKNKTIKPFYPLPSRTLT